MSDNQFSKNTLTIAVVAVVALALVAFVIWYSVREPEPQTAQPAQPAPEPTLPAERPEPPPQPEPTTEPEPGPEPKPEPKPEPEPKVTLPPLDESDAFISEQLRPQAGESLMRLVVNEEIARKMVRAVIGVADQRLVNQYRPVRSPLPPLKVEQISSGPNSEYQLTEENFQRYLKHVALLESIPPAQAARLYDKMAPIFSEAYSEQGLDGDFKTVLLDAIDTVLATPNVDRPLKLTRPTVMYKFADPELETLPAPQKLLLRMGPDNAERVKAYLREFKAELEK